MIKLKELVSVLIAAIIFSFVVSFGRIFKTGLTLEFFLTAFLICLVILFLDIFIKKLTARYLDASTEHSLLTWQRYGFYERSYFKIPIPAGVILPFIFAILSQGYFYVLTFLQFEVTPLVSRVKKSVGLYRFSEMTEEHIGTIASSGIVLGLIASFIAYLIGGDAFIMFSKLYIYYICWSMIPIGNTDGNKIFFGFLLTWVILGILCLIALAYALFLI